MKILTRHVLTSKSIDEVTQILRSSVYFGSKAKIDKSAFSMYCARRHTGRCLWLIPVRGNIEEREDKVEVTLEIHADINGFVGGVIVLLGVIELICGLVFFPNRWIPYLGTILLGLIVAGESFWKGFQLLDLLEHKLTR